LCAIRDDVVVVRACQRSFGQRGWCSGWPHDVYARKHDALLALTRAVGPSHAPVPARISHFDR
jgi:hypothetical protein